MSEVKRTAVFSEVLQENQFVRRIYYVAKETPACGTTIYRGTYSIVAHFHVHSSVCEESTIYRLGYPAFYRLHMQSAADYEPAQREDRRDRNKQA